MQDPKQLYLFNDMEYDDYESNDWEDILFREDELELESELDVLTDSLDN